MRKLFFVTIMSFVIVIVFTTYSKMSETSKLPELSLMNLDALADIEYEDPCVEWATKTCYKEFSNENDPNVYYATCSGSPTVVGGMLECGAVTGRKPKYPFSGEKCLECVRTAGGDEVG